MQSLSNKVGSQTAQLNEKDMQQRRKNLHNIVQKLSGSSGIDIGVDGRYNSSTYGSRRKCGQNASQAILTATGQCGQEKEILGLFVQNKLCWSGAWLRSRGFDAKCPNHAGCTANTGRTETISEYTMGIELGKAFTLDEVLISNVVTDGDSRSHEGIQLALHNKNPLWNVLRQSDTTHLGMSQFKKTVKCEFSRGFFPTHLKTKAERSELQRVLAEDVRTRCHITFNNLYELCDGNVKRIALQLPSLVKTILDCYNGDHEQCQRRRGNIIGCGGGKSNNWFKKSYYLNSLVYRITDFDMTMQDRKLLKEIIKMKLGMNSLEMLKLNLNTNKNEAIHRGYSASLPKNVNFSKNVHGRVHSAVHRLNNNIGDSLHMKLENVGAPLPKGGCAAKAVQQIQNESIFHREYQKRKIVTERAAYSQRNQRFEYNQAKKNRKPMDMYKKGLLDDSPKVESLASFKRNQRKRVHTYSQSIWSV